MSARLSLREALCHNAPVMSYLALRNLHIITAIMTVSGFMLRGYWSLSGSARLGLPLVRILPHIIDTVFLASGVAMLWTLRINPLTHGWLLAKFGGLLAYILLGTIALKRGRTRQVRAVALVGALAVFAYIVGVALTKSPLGWLTV